jgi:hypothetical protein
VLSSDVVLVTNNRGGTYTSLTATPLTDEVLFTLFNPLERDINTFDLEYSILVVKP